MSAQAKRALLLLICAVILLTPLFKGAVPYRQAYSADPPREPPETEEGEASPEEPTDPDADTPPPEADEATESETPSEPSEAGETEEEPEGAEEGDSEPPKPSNGLPARDQTQTDPSEEETEEETETPAAEEPPPKGVRAPESRVVKTFAELRDALANNNGVTEVHLGRDITIQVGGIHIHNSKTNLVIDGLDPENPDQTEPYTLTDYSSATFTDSIYINSSGVKNLIVRDLNIVGKNYYGPFSVLDSSVTAGLVQTFERVDYNGPQLGHHRQGTIRIVDCTVRIHGENGGSIRQEFSEAKHLVFEGVNTIHSASSAYSIFWHPFGGTFTLGADASLTVTSPDTSSTFGVFFADATAYKISLTIGRRATFDATISGVLAPTLYSTLTGLTVREGGEFRLTGTKAITAPLISLTGPLTVEEEAAVQIRTAGSSAHPALDIESGDIGVAQNAVFRITTTGSHPALINLHGRAFLCDDPANVVLYNTGNRLLLGEDGPSRVYLNAQQINYWNTPSPDSLDAPPLYGWRKADGAKLWIEGTLQTGAGGNLGSLTSNYAAGDPPGTAPSAGTFNMVAARVVALGRLELMVNTPVRLSDTITGFTAPGAVVRAWFSQGGSDYTSPDAIADADGKFSIPLGVPLEALTTVSVKSGWMYLTETTSVTVEQQGALTFSVPEILRFSTTELGPTTQTIHRMSHDWQAVVTDTRGPGHTWSVLVSAPQPLTPATPSRPALQNAFIFVRADGGASPLQSGGGLEIYSYTTASDSDIVGIGWPANRGILVRVPTGAAYAGETYTGLLEWTLQDAP